MSKYPYRDLGTGFDRNFRNDLNANFDDVEADLRDIRNDIDAKDSAAQARMTQIENDSIERDNGLDARIDNIVANAGNSNTEIVDARYDSINNVTYPTLKDRLDDTSDKIGNLTTMKEVEESALLGEELVTADGWILGNGWSGDFSTGFTHEAGNTEPLIYPLNAEAWKLYEVVLTVESTDADHGFKFNVTVGDSYPFEMYRGAGNTITYRNGIQAVSDGDLKIIPKTNFIGTIKDVSVKEIVGKIPPTTIIKDKTDKSVYEARPTKADNENIFIGKQSGQYNTSGRANVAIGHGALENNTSGYFNSALGYRALEKNTVGSRNLALAYAALQNNISGHRNVALGTFALNRNTHGHNNIAVGADTLWYNTTGSHNIAMGLTALEFNETGVGNIAIGYRSLSENKSNHFMVAIGYDAGKSLKSDSSVAIGSWAMKSTTTGKENTAVGGYSLQSNVTGQYNVAVGAFAGGSSTGNENTFIGRSAGAGLTTGHQNVFVGRSAGSGLKTGTKNIFIGCETTAREETLHNHLNIGNTIYADMANDMVGIGVDDPRAILDLKAGSAARPPIRLKAGELTQYVFGGAIEYDGSALYITLADGVRRKFVLESV